MTDHAGHDIVKCIDLSRVNDVLTILRVNDVLNIVT
jgi:hypothetical protein